MNDLHLKMYIAINSIFSRYQAPAVLIISSLPLDNYDTQKEDILNAEISFIQDILPVLSSHVGARNERKSKI